MEKKKEITCIQFFFYLILNLNDQGSKKIWRCAKDRANDKTRTKLRGGWPKLIGRAFSTIVDSLSFYSYPRFTLRETYMARVVRSREIFQRQWPEAIYFLFSPRGTIPWREGEESLYFSIFLFSFFFFPFRKEKHPSLFERRDFSRSTVAQFSKIRERFSFARDANHPSISRDYPAPRFDLWSGKEVYSFFLSGGFLVDLRMDRRWNFEIETYSVLNIKEVIIWWNES